MSAQDLFDTLIEAAEERSAIMHESNCYTPEAFEADRHQNEVRCLMRWFYPEHPEQMKEFLQMVEQKRGKDAAEKLRNDCRDAWIKKNREAK